MLKCRDPKIIRGPEILSSWSGESEENIRKVFAEAVDEQKRFGSKSWLHLIIFDEIDAICKQRGMGSSKGGNTDSLVNQLLAMIDGVEELDNILVIGTTNRLDMIDSALLRPGRFELKLEIPLPDEAGRKQILEIHTKRLNDHNLIKNDVNLAALASQTQHFSGAELEGLVRAAVSSATTRLLKSKNAMRGEKLIVSSEDFQNALQHDIKPALTDSSSEMDSLTAGGFVEWGWPVKNILEESASRVKQVRESQFCSLISILLEGPPKSGKSTLAAMIARRSNFEYVKLCSPKDLLGLNESAKCSFIRQIFDDASRSTQSCIVLDDIERLIDYGPSGPVYSNLTLQT